LGCITKGNIEFISAITFFSRDADALGRFYTSFIGEKDLSPFAFTNMKIFRAYDKTWYDEELLAIILDFQTSKIKLFKIVDKNLGKNTVEAVTALGLPADQALAIYRDYWELKGMYRLAQIYDEASVAMQYTSVCNPL
jgi:hypothetical protein